MNKIMSQNKMTAILNGNYANDIRLDLWRKRPVSWSQISSFEYNPEQWYRRYFLCEEGEKTAELEFGSKIGNLLSSNPKYLPHVPRLDTFEFEFKTKIHGIEVIGYADSFDTKTFRALKEYKTGAKIWDQKRADNHGQITFYLLMNYLMHRVKPLEVDVEIVWLPTQKKDDKDFKRTVSFIEPIKKTTKIFKTKRTMVQILEFSNKIKETREKMEAYIRSNS